MNPILTGRFIRVKRKSLGLSQSKLAEMLCVEPQTVSKWERGLGMPDYDNLDRLREILDCSLSDILEPSADSLGESSSADPSEEKESVASLPIPFEPLDGAHPRKKRGFGFFDFLSSRKIKALLEKMFGYEYANTYNEKFLFKDLFRRRSREECETTLTQGMFRGKMNSKRIGIEAPWLYMSLFLFLLLCSGISLLTAFVGIPMPFIVIGGLFSVLPLLMFLFESNFARNLSIVDVLKMVTIGGLCSILLTLFAGIAFPSDGVLYTVVGAPILEELCKALVVVFFISRCRSTNMLTGLLIGFSVGAGFTFFENLHYAYMVALGGAAVTGDLSLAISDSIFTIVLRTLYDFAMGHHYWTGTFGAIYVLFKKKSEFAFEDLLNWRVLLALLGSILLHVTWNGSSVMPLPILPTVMRLFVCVASVTILLVLINVGIAQTRVLGIWQDYRSEHGESTEQSAELGVGEK